MTVGPASVKSAEQVSKLEIPTGVHIVVLSIKAVWNRTPLSSRDLNLFSLSLQLTGWDPPIMVGNPLYSKSTDLNTFTQHLDWLDCDASCLANHQSRYVFV